MQTYKKIVLPMALATAILAGAGCKKDNIYNKALDVGQLKEDVLRDLGCYNFNTGNTMFKTWLDKNGNGQLEKGEKEYNVLLTGQEEGEIKTIEGGIRRQMKDGYRPRVIILPGPANFNETDYIEFGAPGNTIYVTKGIDGEKIYLVPAGRIKQINRDVVKINNGVGTAKKDDDTEPFKKREISR